MTLKNNRLGLKPPYTGMHNNEFFDTGMGCPIRSEIWGYVFPGAPDLAAKYAYMDGTLDHTDEAVCSEQMQAAMAADAFFISDLRRLTKLHIHYLKPDLIVRRLIEALMTPANNLDAFGSALQAGMDPDKAAVAAGGTGRPGKGGGQ